MMSSHPSWLNKHCVPRHGSAVVLATWGSGKTLENEWLMKPHCLGRALHTSLALSMALQFTTTQKLAKLEGYAMGARNLSTKTISALDVLYGLR